MTGAATQVQAFVQSAQDAFGLHSHAGRGTDNPHYMSMPLQLSNERLISDRTAPEEVRILESPFLFLTGIPEGDRPPFRGEPSASVPSVSLLVGEYGLGKTEFVFQLCEHLRANRHRRAPAPLPINLATCRWLVQEPEEILRTTPDWRSFARLIFAPVLRRWPGLGDEFFERELMPAIHRGEAMLILDALDELATNRDQHVHFFQGLRALLDMAGPYATRFRCLVSMRFEYISAVDTPSADELVTAVRCGSGPMPGVHFLHMDFLNDSWVESYLRHTSTMESLVDTLQVYPGFYELLHRPIFLQMIRAIDQSPLTISIDQLQHPVQFVKAFVEVAGAVGSKDVEGPYFHERDLVVGALGYMWNADLMARRALAKYQRTGGHIAFKPEDIASFLVPVGEGAEHPLGLEQIMLSVQKCPFLHQLSEDTVVFSHKVFLEYFVSRGIVLDLDESGEAFDRLVLNSDMRYFLKFMVEEKFKDKDEWYRRTLRSYAMDRLDEWGLFDVGSVEKVFTNLDDIRRTLLNSMTEPRKFDSDIARKAIRDFFAYDDSNNLHPRYLMYNYEAVAVYLWLHRWQEDDLWLLHEFSERLVKRAKALAAELRDGPEIDREGHELLAERIVSIARRLQLTNVAHIPLHAVVKAEDIKERMKARSVPGAPENTL